MAKEKVSKVDLEAKVLAAMREVPGCEGFVAAQVHKVLERRLPFTWSIGRLTYGDADEETCNEAIGEVVAKLRAGYDIV